MKRKLLILGVLVSLVGCKSVPTTPAGDQPVVAVIDLVNVTEDKVQVSVNPDRFTTDVTTFYIPKTVPGTYSEDNYGKFIEDFKAMDHSGKELAVEKLDQNSWRINNASDLDLVTYRVNDSYDVEGEEGVFSPSGTNIEAKENFMLNLHSFVGYFEDQKEEPYRLEILRPEGLIAGSALTPIPGAADAANGVQKDIFNVGRYFEVIDHPIMYAEPDTTSFVVDGMEVLINVYSPNKVYSSEIIKPGIMEMVTAQKNFLGEIDDTDKYAILLYLSDTNAQDARGFGALEHHTSTVVVLPEAMPLETLQKSMTDVVSHEFFHILTPLGVHSEEVHYFDYNDPKMSKHLWMYEGVTEYFANLFQVNQGLIENQEFYNRMIDKISSSRNFDDTIPFTLMSENVLEDQYKDSYYNVYLKGALIGMALDIRLRELSKGEMGLLDLMKSLSSKYGKDKPFQDDQLINDIVALTYPEIQQFFNTYVTGTTPILYGEFFEKVGLEEEKVEVPSGILLHQQVPYIDVNPDTNELFFRKDITLNSFLTELGVGGGDIIKSINGTDYNLDSVYNLIGTTEGWQEGQEVKLVVVRDGQEITLEGKVSKPTVTEIRLVEKDLPEDHEAVQLRKAWLED